MKIQMNKISELRFISDNILGDTFFKYNFQKRIYDDVFYFYVFKNGYFYYEKNKLNFVKENIKVSKWWHLITKRGDLGKIIGLFYNEDKEDLYSSLDTFYFVVGEDVRANLIYEKYKGYLKKVGRFFLWRSF